MNLIFGPVIRGAIFILIFLGSYTTSFAQQKGNLRVFTRPSEAIIKLDTQNLSFGKFIELDTGSYVIEAWAPLRLYVEKEVQIDSGSFKTLRIDLPYREQYKSYKINKKLYALNKLLLRVGPLIAYTAYMSNTYSKLQNYQDDAEKFKSDVEVYKNAYEAAVLPANLRLNEGRFNASLANYNDAIDGISLSKTQLVSATATAIVVTYFSWKLANKLKKPTYKEDVMLSEVRISPMLDPNASGITLNMKLK